MAGRGERKSFLERALLASLACSGVIVAHAVAYVFSVRDAHLSEVELAATGGSLQPLVFHSLQLFAASLVAGYAGLGASSRDREMGITRVFLQLAVVHLVLFSGMEWAEALDHGSGAPWTNMAFWGGIPLQLATAALGALLFGGARKLVRTLFASDEAGGEATTEYFPAYFEMVPLRRFGSSARSRAPPLQLTS